MGIFQINKNKGGANQDNGYKIISGLESILERAVNNGINNLFLESKLIEKLPEVPVFPSFNIEADLNFLWTSVYSLSITNRRSLAFTYEQSFLDFIGLEKYFIGNKSITGGIVLFFFKNSSIKKVPFAFEKIFPIYNYYKLSGFLDNLPYYFELSEKLKLPVLIYLNDSVMNEYYAYEKKEYTERTAAKIDFSFANFGDNNDKANIICDLSQNVQLFKNTGKHVEFFKGNSQSNLIFTDSKYFHRIMENRTFSENSDIILFNLINPVDYSHLTELVKSNCANFYKNIFIFDDYALLRYQLADFLKNNKELLQYENLKLIGGEIKNDKLIELGFCSDEFTLAETKNLKSFCPGCTLFTFLQALEKKLGGRENCVLIGDEGCFSLIKFSSLKFSFQNIIVTENPIFFSYNLRSKNPDRSFYIFISSEKFSEHFDKFIKMQKEPNFNGNITVVAYKSILDFDYNFNLESLILNPLLKSFKKISIKNGTRLKDLNSEINSPLIFIDNNCVKSAKTGRNLNYISYLTVNNSICNKLECRLCYQKTKCPAIKIKENKDIFIEPEICNLCRLCIDICPNNAIKSKRRKKIKIKKSLESKINL